MFLQLQPRNVQKALDSVTQLEEESWEAAAESALKAQEAQRELEEAQSIHLYLRVFTAEEDGRAKSGDRRPFPAFDTGYSSMLYCTCEGTSLVRGQQRFSASGQIV